MFESVQQGAVAWARVTREGQLGVPAGLGLGAGEPLAVAFGGTVINLLDLFS